jgi:hypothetical protein
MPSWSERLAPLAWGAILFFGHPRRLRMAGDKKNNDDVINEIILTVLSPSNPSARRLFLIRSGCDEQD